MKIENELRSQFGKIAFSTFGNEREIGGPKND